MKKREFNPATQSLYFIAIVPGEPVQSELIKFKEYSRDVFRSSRSLNSPAHITLLPPFSLERKNELKLVDDINNSILNRNSFYLELKGFGHFGNKVIFVSVSENENATYLYKKLHCDLVSYHDYGVENDRKFHPHITIAFKDLTPEAYKPAWDNFSKISYERIVKIEHIDLLRHDNKKWISIKRFKLN